MPAKTQTAVVIQTGRSQGPSDGHDLPLAVSHNAPIPHLASPHHVLVRVLAVALNPNDHKMTVHFPMEGNTAGCDFCGIIEAVGETPAHAAGSRVCGAAFPYKPGDTGGSFANYLAVDSRLLVAVPPAWSDLQGAALGGVGWSTLSMAFSDPEALALAGTPSQPVEKALPVLVYGGSTATGTLACQLLKQSGYDPIAVTSAVSAPLVSRFGARGVAVYNDPASPCIEQIGAAAKGLPIRYALDCITDAQSATTCFAALSRTGGRYACLEQLHPAWRTRRAVKVKEVMGFEVLGVDVDLGPETTYSRKASARLHAIGMDWAKEMERMVADGLIYPHPPVEVKSETGQWWDAVIMGLGRLQRGDVRGQKLVVTIAPS